MTGSLTEVFAHQAKATPDQTALVTTGGSVSFGVLHSRAVALAGAFSAQGVLPGTRVLVCVPVGVPLYVTLAALWHLGAVVVFPEPAMGLKGLRHAIRATRPAAFVASGWYRVLKCLPDLWRVRMLSPSARGPSVPAHEVAAGDPALISFTSGSTGAPKGMVRSHGLLMAQFEAVRPLLGEDRTQVDLVGFPVFVLVNLALGRTSVLPNWKLTAQDRASGPNLAKWIAASSVTRALLPPSICETLAGASWPGTLHTVFTGGGPVKPALVARMQEARPGLRVVSVFGSTEAEPIADLDWADVSADDRRAMQQGAGLLVGPPVPQTDLRIVDDEIVVAGDHVNDGYLDPSMNAETKINEGGRVWHRTGDAGRCDPQGRVWLLGRRSAVIDIGGGRLYPFAVEMAAEAWPGVRRAALANVGGEPVLAIEADLSRDATEYRDAAVSLGIHRVQRLAKIPLDARHRSKVDLAALRTLLER